MRQQVQRALTDSLSGEPVWQKKNKAAAEKPKSLMQSAKAGAEKGLLLRKRKAEGFRKKPGAKPQSKRSIEKAVLIKASEITTSGVIRPENILKEINI